MIRSRIIAWSVARDTKWTKREKGTTWQFTRRWNSPARCAESNLDINIISGLIWRTFTSLMEPFIYVIYALNILRLKKIWPGTKRSTKAKSLSRARFAVKDLETGWHCGRIAVLTKIIFTSSRTSSKAIIGESHCKQIEKHGEASLWRDQKRKRDGRASSEKVGTFSLATIWKRLPYRKRKSDQGKLTPMQEQELCDLLSCLSLLWEICAKKGPRGRPQWHPHWINSTPRWRKMDTRMILHRSTGTDMSIIYWLRLRQQSSETTTET